MNVEASNIIDVLEWTATASGLLGAVLLASNTRFSRWGWFGFLIANLCSIGFALGIAREGLLLKEIGFTACSFLGLVRSGFLSVKFGRRELKSR